MRKFQRVEGLLASTTSGRESVSALLSCRRVTRTFGALKAVDKMTFDVPPGIVFGIGGPNGAGKTTLFDLICGLTPLSSGEVVFKGRQISGLKPFEICHAGVARTFQLNAAFETMTVRENLLIAIQHGIDRTDLPRLFFNKSEHRWAEEVLEMTDLQDVADETVARLPLLKQKLLMIAAAIGTRPGMLLLDEPVGGLIPREIDLVEKVIRSLASESGMTVMLIEHVMRFLVGLSDEVMIMNYGEILYKGPPQGLSKDQKVVETYLGKGTSGRLQSQSQEPTDSAKTADYADDEVATDAWNLAVAAASRKLLKQHQSGRIYPIDYLRLERLIFVPNASPKPSAVARIAFDIVKAQSLGEPVSQKFELLSRVFEEGLKRRLRVVETNPVDDNQDSRSAAIEEAARRLFAGDQAHANAEALAALKLALESGKAGTENVKKRGAR